MNPCRRGEAADRSWRQACANNQPAAPQQEPPARDCETLAGSMPPGTAAPEV